jgi:restriction system protein
MAVPDFQTLMLPLLQLMSDGKERKHAQVFTALSEQFQLTQDDLSDLLPSGTQVKFVNRVRWAKWYLTRAGLLESTSRGIFRISPTGVERLAQTDDPITAASLKGSDTDISLPAVENRRSAGRTQSVDPLFKSSLVHWTRIERARGL